MNYFYDPKDIKVGLLLENASTNNPNDEPYNNSCFVITSTIFLKKARYSWRYWKNK